MLIYKKVRFLFMVSSFFYKVNFMTTKSTMTELILEKRTAVSDLLAELNLESSYFAVLINGRTAGLDHIIDEGEKVIILPKIAGG